MSNKRKKIDMLCDYVRKLHYEYNLEYSISANVDRQIHLRSRIILLQSILDEASMIKRRDKS